MTELELTTDFEPVFVAFELEHDHLFFELFLLLILFRVFLSVIIRKNLPIQLIQNTIPLLFHQTLLILSRLILLVIAVSIVSSSNLVRYELCQTIPGVFNLGFVCFDFFLRLQLFA